MNLVIKPIADITVPVTIPVPGSDETATIRARWRLHTFSEFQAILEKQRRGEMTDDELVAQDLLGVEGVSDEQGKAVAFDDALRDQLMNTTYVRKPLVLSWFPAQQGRDKEAAKN